MNIPQPTTIDFETLGIEGRPDYPPIPVGMAIKDWGSPAQYFAWGHPTGNNICWGKAKEILEGAWERYPNLLFHNAKFDVDVAETHFGLKRREWTRYHDTMFLLFLNDPHAKDLGLKPSAEKLLKMKPGERDAVKDWLLKHQPLKHAGITISASAESEHYFGRYIAWAPGDLVGKYALGDVIRTERLFKHLWPKIEKAGMLAAYDRERELMPILLESERHGMRVDFPRLEKDLDTYGAAKNKLEAWIRKQLKAPELNVDSGTQLVRALVEAGKADEEALGVTEKGRLKSDKASLEVAVKDKRLAASLKYRASLKTCMGTFMGPWAITARKSGGRIFTNWNQTRGGDRKGGARTGRLSSTPNFQNIPQQFKPMFTQKRGDGLPKPPFPLPALPLVRSYIIPDPGHVLVGRDYSQQELRVLAHFEDGALKESYLKDPWMDVHEYARQMINRMTGKDFPRKIIKNTGFGIIYGMGIGLLAQNSDVTVETAKEVKDAYLALFPGLKELYQDMKLRMVYENPIRTWGGRLYYCEPAREIEGRTVTFDYKLVNYLVQGSSADCTKEAVLIWKRAGGQGALMALVHDETLLSVPRKALKRAMNALRTAMEAVKFDVPMLSEGSWSPSNWAEMKPFDRKGELCL